MLERFKGMFGLSVGKLLDKPYKATYNRGNLSPVDVTVAGLKENE